MLRQLFLCNTGILFYKHTFTGTGLDPDTIYPHVIPRPTPIPLENIENHLLLKHAPYYNFAKRADYLKLIDHPFVSEEDEDLMDAICPIYDQLKLAKGWWTLELLPHKNRYQRADDTWVRETGCVNTLCFVAPAVG